MIVKFKIIEDGKAPFKATDGSACYDLYARGFVFYSKYIEYKLGVAFEIPKGYCGLIFPRSSVTNKDLILKNCVGIIDSDYRGEVTARFYNTSNSSQVDHYNSGERVAQILFIPVLETEMIQSAELSDTPRGKGGYGSTGK